MSEQRTAVPKLLTPAMLIALVCSMGCSEVIVDPDGSGGRSGSPSGGDGDDGGRSSGQDGASSGYDPTLCTAFCDAVGTCVPACGAKCQGYLHAPCGAQGAALVACYTDHYDVAMCNATECDAEMQALVACRSKTKEECSGGGCGGSGAECSCQALCEGGDRQVLCENNGGVASCGCYLNSILVGECSGEWSSDFSDFACSIGEGCCADVFGDCEGCL